VASESADGCPFRGSRYQIRSPRVGLPTRGVCSRGVGVTFRAPPVRTRYRAGAVHRALLQLVWPLLLPSRPWPVAGLVLRVFAVREPPDPVRENGWGGSLVTFASPSERRIRSEVLAAQLPARSALASRGIHSMVSPPPTYLLRVHSRWRCRHLRSTGCRFGRLVPPSWFRTTPTVFSANEFRAYCIPVPEGVRSVSASGDHSSSARRQVPPDKSGGRWKSGRSGVSPTAPSHPSKKSPLQQPCHIAVVVAPSSSCLRVGHRFQCLVRRPSTSRLCSAVGSVATVAVASEQSPSPSMGFVPLQGSLAGSDPRPGVSPHRLDGPSSVDPASMLPSWSFVPPRRCDPPLELPTSLVVASLPSGFSRCCCQSEPPVRSLSGAVRSRSVRHAFEPRL
jgi:hypothetical protein